MVPLAAAAMLIFSRPMPLVALAPPLPPPLPPEVVEVVVVVAPRNDGVPVLEVAGEFLTLVPLLLGVVAVRKISLRRWSKKLSSSATPSPVGLPSSFR